MSWNEAVARVAQEESREVPAPSKPAKRRSGQRGGIDWKLAERMYVHGGHRAEDGRMVYPTLQDIAVRVGCSKAMVSIHADRYGWAARREAAENADAARIVREALDSRARPTRKPGDVLDAYLALWEQAILAGRVPIASLGDYERAVKLKAHLDEQERRTTEQAGTLNLDQLRARHRTHVGNESGLTDEAAGVLAHGEAPGVDGPDIEAGDGAQADPMLAHGGGTDPFGRIADSVGKRQSKAPETPKPSKKKRGK